jgi:hypothetical protein
VLMSNRADERTRTADLLITNANSCVAGGYKSRIFKPDSFPCLARLAQYCVPGGVRSSSLASSQRQVRCASIVPFIVN